ncbi:hypothetical protein D3C76_1348120 [compost metagenome]
MDSERIRIGIFHKIPRLHLIQFAVFGQVRYGLQRFGFSNPAGVLDLHTVDGNAAAKGNPLNQFTVKAFKGGQFANRPGLITVVQRF